MPDPQDPISAPKMSRRKWLAAGGLSLLVACGALAFHFRAATPVATLTSAHAPSPTPIVLPTKPEDWRGRIDYRALDQRLADLTAHHSMEGLAVAVVEDGRLSFVQGYGLTSAKDGEPVDAHTVFRWASLSKTVAGTLTAKLAADGLLSLDEPLETFHTTLRLPRDAQRELTVEQLLSQRTGLPKNAYDDRLEDGQDPAMIRHALGDVPVACAPGRCHTYQNIAYDTITEILATRTHEAYDQTVQRRLFQPLGMTSATIGQAGLVSAARWARPHREGRLLPMSDAYYRVPSAAGVNSTIVDLAVWMQAQMGLRPDVLPPAVLDAAQRPRIGTAPPYGRAPFAREIKHAGYGLGMRSFAYRGHRVIGHSGAVSGYRSTMVFDPATKTGIVMLWNSDAGLPFRFQAEFLDRAYGLPFTDWLDLKTVSDQRLAQARHLRLRGIDEAG